MEFRCEMLFMLKSVDGMSDCFELWDIMVLFLYSDMTDMSCINCFSNKTLHSQLHIMAKF